MTDAEYRGLVMLPRYNGPKDTAVGYIRVSMVGGRGDDLVSPELQKHSQEVWAAANNVEIVAWIYDLDRSGRSFSKRQVNTAVAGVKRGDWKYILLWKWSRWGRNLRESQVYLGHAEAAGAEVRATTEDFDPKTTMGRFTRDQLLLIAQLQSDMISDDWKENQDRRRRAGLPHTGGKRFGYIYEKRTGHTPDPDLAPLLKNFYERYALGESHRSMATELNAAGITTTKGNPWTGKSIAATMDTGFAAGLIREKSNPADADGNGGVRGHSIDRYDVWRKGAHAPIISIDLWEQYKERRMAMKELPPRLRTPAHALSGVMQCGECGYAMAAAYSGQANSLGWTCTKARDTKLHRPNNLKNYLAEEAVLKWLVRNATSDHSVTEEARRIEQGRQAKGVADGLDKEIERLKQKRSRLANTWTDGEIEREDYLAQKAEIATKLAEKTAQRDEARVREKASGVNLIRRFGALAEEWPRLTPGDRREALLSVVSVIKVFPGSDYKDALDDGKLVPVPLWEGRRISPASFSNAGVGVGAGDDLPEAVPAFVSGHVG